MRFGQKLRDSIYSPWSEQYIDYAKLKHLLREDNASGDDDGNWTEQDEQRFCDEILNVQLDKVADFQESTLEQLELRANDCSDKLRELAPEDGGQHSDINAGRFKEIETELDSITNEVKELKNYSSLNYTGFLKIVKKHDRKRGGNYKVRPILQLRLAKRPFNSEAVYTPLLNKLSMMYHVVSESGKQPAAGTLTTAEAESQEQYTAYKFWVHPDNLLEVKTFILRRLPVLVYSQQSSKDADAAKGDPTITSLYFDNSKFALYSQKVDRQVDASSVRLRWYGQLKDKPEIVLEQKIIDKNGKSEERKFPIKEKYVQQYIKGEYKMEKSIQKLERQGRPEDQVNQFKTTVNEIQEYLQRESLEPVLRANYTRTAFQKPLDDRVRISIDTQLAFIREDALDLGRPCRRPNSWHRLDIDDTAMEYPFSNVHQGEISRFPFPVLEIKVKEDGAKKAPQWIQDLMASHLVHRAPNFSKFVHGVASVFEDHVNTLPFWLSEVEMDIRKDPHDAFEEEETRKAKQAENDMVAGSLLGTSARRSSSYKPAVSSPLGKSYMQDHARHIADASSRRRSMLNETSNANQANGDKDDTANANQNGYGTISSIFPSFSSSKYAQARRQKKVQLPPGVVHPGQLIKDSGPLKVEPKVWLANERTFLKWQHICILLGGLAVSLYTAAGKNMLAEFMGIAYIVIAIFAGAWGYYMHYTRRNMIVARSGKDFDNIVGPMVVSFALVVSLAINFIFKYREALHRFKESDVAAANGTIDDDIYSNWNVDLL